MENSRLPRAGPHARGVDHRQAAFERLLRKWNTKRRRAGGLDFGGAMPASARLARLPGGAISACHADARPACARSAGHLPGSWSMLDVLVM